MMFVERKKGRTCEGCHRTSSEEGAMKWKGKGEIIKLEQKTDHFVYLQYLQYINHERILLRT